MLLRLQPCETSLILVLLHVVLVQTMLVLVEAVPATRAPGRRRSTSTSTASPTPPLCVDPSTTTAPATPPAAATTTPPTPSLAATNSTWPRQWVGPAGTPPPTPPPTSVLSGLPPGVAAGGSSVRDNLVEDEEGKSAHCTLYTVNS